MIPNTSVQIQGQGAVSDDQLNSFLQGALNVAQLRTVTGLTTMTVWLLGTATISDGGQGMFFWDPLNTAPDDNGVTTIIPTGSPGNPPYSPAWVRQPLTGGGGGGPIPISSLQNIVALTMLGNNTNATGPILQLTRAQVAAMLLPFMGDTGTGGAQGVVPAPPSGSAASGLVLGAGGSWVAPGGVGAQYYAQDTGVINALVAAPPSAPSSYTAGIFAFIKAAQTNTGPSTLDLNGLGAKAILSGGQALTRGAIQSGNIYLFSYSGASFQLIGGPGVTANSNGTAVNVGGQITQRGTVSVVASGGAQFYNLPITFPIPFPNACDVCLGTAQNEFDGSQPPGATSGNYDIVIVGSLTTTGAVAAFNSNRGGTFSGTHTVMWIAIGS